MSSVFKNQGYFILTLETGLDISSATVLKILYKNPIGGTGYFAGTLVGTTQMKYQFTNSDLLYAGDWEFQAYVEIGGLKAYGDIVLQEIKPVIS